MYLYLRCMDNEILLHCLQDEASYLYLTYVLKFDDFSPTFHRGSTMTFVG